MNNQDILNEINDQIIANLEKQISNFQEIVKIDEARISQLEKALEVARERYECVIFGKYPSDVQDNMMERYDALIADTITKDTKGS